MPLDNTIDPALQAEWEAVYAFYVALMRDSDADKGIGGRLLYAGELDSEGSRLVRAANIAGAASLSATSDPAIQRQAMREGVIDFLVTSLDEALRILKNEIRKRNGVAVCVMAPPPQIASEMNERGVLPDLLGDGLADGSDKLTLQGARCVEPLPRSVEHRLVFLPFAAPGEPESIAACDPAAARWLRLAPRYLGPQGRRIRSVPREMTDGTSGA